MSVLRPFKTKRDRRAFRLLMFAREYYGKKFLFMTLTNANHHASDRRSRSLSELLKVLRKRSDIEYFSCRTGEGNGVYHLALISGYLPHQVIRGKWHDMTGAWNTHVSMERSFPAFVREMTGQNGEPRYSKSKNFVPLGVPDALDSLYRLVSPQNRVRSYKQFARRLKASGNLDESRWRASVCCDNFYGMASDLKTRLVYNVGVRNVG